MLVDIYWNLLFLESELDICVYQCYKIQDVNFIKLTLDVNVNWRKIEKNFHATLDINNDGKIDEKDL